MDKEFRGIDVQRFGEQRELLDVRYEPGSIYAVVHDSTLLAATLELLRPGVGLIFDSASINVLRKVVERELRNQTALLELESMRLNDAADPGRA